MKKIVLGVCAVAAFASCDFKDKARETLNKSSETVGEMATEIGEGISEGIDRTLESKVVLSDALKAKGISTGKFYIEKDSLSKNDNKLVIYLVTDKDFNGPVTFKVSDKKGIEFGRKQLNLNTKAGNAAYYDVVFDPRTDIETKSTIEIQ
jgi:hypothetical protein